MTKFWTIVVAGMYNTLTERFYTYEQAKNEAIKRAQKAPNLTFLVLELKGYAQGTSNTEVSYTDDETEDIKVIDDKDNNIIINITEDKVTDTLGDLVVNISNPVISDIDGNLILN